MTVSRNQSRLRAGSHRAKAKDSIENPLAAE